MQIILHKCMHSQLIRQHFESITGNSSMYSIYFTLYIGIEYACIALPDNWYGI